MQNSLTRQKSIWMWKIEISCSFSSVWRDEFYHWNKYFNIFSGVSFVNLYRPISIHQRQIRRWGEKSISIWIGFIRWNWKEEETEMKTNWNLNVFLVEFEWIHFAYQLSHVNINEFIGSIRICTQNGWISIEISIARNCWMNEILQFYFASENVNFQSDIFFCLNFK